MSRDLQPLPLEGDPFDWKAKLSAATVPSRGAPHQSVGVPKSSSSKKRPVSPKLDASESEMNSISDPKGKKPARRQARSESTSDRPAKKRRVSPPTPLPFLPSSVEADSADAEKEEGELNLFSPLDALGSIAASSLLLVFRCSFRSSSTHYSLGLLA